MKQRPRARHLFMPELIEPVAGPWQVDEVPIERAAVDTEHRHAMVPAAHTPAQRLARLHEGGHVKYSPSPNQPAGGWDDTLARVMSKVKATGVIPDYGAVVTLTKMMEENRVDWLLWQRHGIDTRPAREVLNWALMAGPTDLLRALTDCLQLAWTVWVSRGLSSAVEGAPPPRPPDPDTGEYFDTVWAYVCDENPALSHMMIRACMAIYADPSDAVRDQMAAELAAFFPAKAPPEPSAPPPKPTEVEERTKEEHREEKHEELLEETETGTSADEKQVGTYILHDHTTRVRRPSMRIARRRVPTPQGVDTRYAHRYLLDGAVFSQRLLTEAGIMIDGSSSMRWTHEDMQAVVDRLPAVRVGLYAGDDGKRTGVVGKICILAREGRFSKFTGKDPGMGGGNAVDYEALQLLARWPKPRLWLSDGQVCGGVHVGRAERHVPVGMYGRPWGKLHEMCSALMKRAEILRVPDNDTMHKLLARQRVILYRTTRAGRTENYGEERFDGVYWPANVVPEPVTFTL